MRKKVILLALFSANGIGEAVSVVAWTTGRGSLCACGADKVNKFSQGCQKRNRRRAEKRGMVRGKGVAMKEDCSNKISVQEKRDGVGKMWGLERRKSKEGGGLGAP